MFLKEILTRKREEVKENLARRTWNSLLQEVKGNTAKGKSFSSVLKIPGPSIVAELKRGSPSRGVFASGLVVEKTAALYEKHGAAALSVLTDERYFKGSLTDLRKVRAVTKLPLLRKDFIIDPYQILEAKWAGADAVLLIISALTSAQAAELRHCAQELGLETLVEIHKAEEIEVALALRPEVIGINNRDLSTFRVSLEVTKRLRPLIPSLQPVISESGIKDPLAVAELFALGVDGFLIGETLVTSEDPGKTLQELKRMNQECPV